MFQMHPDKAPGPDGLNPAFFRRFWSLCGSDIILACKQWFSEGSLPCSIGETNTVLIPNCDSHVTMRDLRPISLCNVVYKILAETLAKRLQKVLSKCVSNEQASFVSGRSIIDNVLVASEIIHHLRCKTRGKKGDAALKIDISKAYDRVEWSYLLSILDRMGFSNRWISWMKMCYHGNLLNSY